MFSRTEKNKDGTTTFSMSLNCLKKCERDKQNMLIDALWIDFDRSIAEMCFHIIADNRSRLLTIADDRPIAKKCFHIIADDRWQYFQRSGDRERSYGN